jgi:amino acid adenylation domain-containing protein
MCAEPDGSAVRIASSVTVEFDVQDLSHSEREDALERVDERARAEWTTPFDLSVAPLIRAQLLVLDEESAALLLTLHHFVCDGFSIQTITDDLCAYYDGALHGTEVSRPNAMQYSEYARWQEAERASNEYRAAEAFYVERFREPPPFLELPLDRPRPPLPSFRCAELHDRLEPALVDRLRELGNSRQASFFSTLLASINVWLHQLSRETDLVIGISLAGQTIVGHDELVGHCVNLHPFRTALVPDESFEALLAQVQGGMLDVFQHRNYTYGALLEKIQVPRQANRAPLVALHFNFESEISTRKDGELDIEISTVPRSYHTQELALNFSLDEHGILIKCWHNVELYDSKSVRQWLAAYREIAAAIADRPESEIASLCAATWGSTRSILDGPRVSNLPRETAAGLVAAQVEHTPDMRALQSGPIQLTYREMDERVRALTSVLSEAGVRPGDLVGIALERSADLAVAMQAVWRAGGAYLPLDPEFPGDRLAFMLEDSGTGVVISQRSVESRLPDGFSGTVVLLDEVDWEGPAVFPSAAPSPGDLAYVIYTSGSTGKPKGVEITQGSVANFLQSMQHEPGCETGDRLLAITTLSFDISVLELVLPLTRGGCVAVATADDLRDGASLAAAIEREDPTIMQATPATWRMLFDSGWSGDGNLKALCGGEALPPDLARKLSAVVKQAWNMYGPTEATIWSTCHLMPSSDEPVLIGLPIANTQIHILDDRGQPAPLGIPGEIYIGGAGLARGYLHRPELNAERFVVGPGPEHDRLYRTGDVGRVTVDGQLEYLHRADDQLKLRGFRIEPGEIEAALLEHESVRDVAVAARGDAEGELRLVAYVVFDADDPPTVSELRRFARGKLPRYMVPGLIVELDALPLTPNGKVDRRALPDPLARKREDLGRTPAQTSTERLLSEVWSSALGTQDIAREDNFFELGGHSLSAMRVVFEVERRTDKRMDPRLMFFQSLEQIAAGLDFEPAVAS